VTNDGQIDSTSEHVLHAPLAPEQLALLEAVWETVPAGAPAWPVWDYVARVLYRRSPPVTKPAALLRSLPVLPNADLGNAYGLTWRTELSTQSPAPTTRVGLSIAGLHALRSRDPRAGRLADLAATLIGDLASREREVDPDPTGPVEVRADLDTRIGTLLSGADELARITLDAVSGLLLREFAPLAIEPGEAGRPVAVLRMQLAPYDSVESAETYLDVIANELPRRVRHPVLGPELIPLTLDYLSVILANDPRWASGPLVAAPDLRSASTIAVAVRDAVEFRDRMSALASILERLNVPHVGEPELRIRDEITPHRVGVSLGSRR